MRRLELLCIAMGLAASTCAQQPRPDLTPTQLMAIDTFVERQLKVQHIPGIEVGIYSRGKLLLGKGYGLANVELDVPVTAETMMQSGSTGKQFVSAAIMMLVEQHKLSLDDSVRMYFPAAPATWQPIRIKNLLSHTSGLSEYETDKSFTDPNDPFYLRKDYTEPQLATLLETLPIENPPGETWNYRNTNYVLLGIIVHQLTGQFYADYLHDKIFAPLGMTHTRLISDRDIIPHRAAGYELDDDDQLKNQQYVSPTFNSTADGTLYFNVLDLARWDASLYTTRLLQQSSLDRMWTVFPLNDGKPNAANYGFAWEIDKQQGRKRIEHGGAWQGFTCDISRYPDDSLTVVILTNLDSGHARPALIAHVVAGLTDRSLLPPRFSAMTDADPARTARLRATLDHIQAGENFSADAAPPLTDLMKDGVPPAIKKMVASVWPGGAIELLKQTPTPGSTGGRALYRVTRGDTAIFIRFALTDAGKITTLGFFPSREYDD